MCNFGASLRLAENRFQRVEREAHRADPHRRAVPPALVGYSRARIDPPPKPCPITAIRIPIRVVMKGVDIAGPAEKTVGYGYGQYRVVGESTVLGEQGEISRFTAYELVYGSDDVTGNCTQHFFFVSDSRHCFKNLSLGTPALVYCLAIGRIPVATLGALAQIENLPHSLQKLLGQKRLLQGLHVHIHILGELEAA